MKTAMWDDNNQIKFSGKLTDIEPLGSANLDVKLYLKNLSDVDQAPYLANSGLDLNLQLTNVNCDSLDAPYIESIAVSSTTSSALNVKMSNGGYELASYCVDQIEKSTGECEWITNNDKQFEALVDVKESGLYYLHVKDIRGYIADSAGFDVETLDAEYEEFSFNEPTSPTSYQIKKTGNYQIQLWGASGGTAYFRELHNAGDGAYVSGNIHLEEGTEIFIELGGQGHSVVGTSSFTLTANGNGYNGGKAGSYYRNNSNHGGGGGATDIRIGGTSLNDRIMVAAGGGGASSHDSRPSYSGVGGAGGGLTGYGSPSTNDTCYAYGTGGNQTAGGRSVKCLNDGRDYTSTVASFGMADGLASYVQDVYASGGGGWYGGGRGFHAAGGGGSSYISGHMGCVTITALTNSTAKSGCLTENNNIECSKHPNGYIFRNTEMIDGKGFTWSNTKGEQKNMPNPLGGYYEIGKGHTGNGYAKISPAKIISLY